METLDRDLCERVDALIQAHKAQDLLSTTGTQAAIGELAARTAGLEQAIREIALQVQKLTASE